MLGVSLHELQRLGHLLLVLVGLGHDVVEGALVVVELESRWLLFWLDFLLRGLMLLSWFVLD